MKANQFVRLAQQQIGKPYVFGAEGPDTFDCSGLVQYALGLVGIAAPRTSQEQQAWATPVREPRPGDLVFFGQPAYHVGIYLGDGVMINAPAPGTTVRVDPVGTPTGYGRVPGLGTAVAPLVGAALSGGSRVADLLGGARDVVTQLSFILAGVIVIGAGVFLVATRGRR